MLDKLRKVADLDRRIIFLIIALSVIVPTIFPISLPIAPSQAVTDAYDKINKVPEGGTIYLSFDFGPSTRVELYPIAEAMFDQALSRDVNVVCATIYAEGKPFISEVMEKMKKKYPEKKYGEHYVDLGFKVGAEAAVVAMGLGFREFFPADASGTPIGQIPLMKKVNSVQDFDVMATISAGYPGALEYIRVNSGQMKRPLIVATTAVTEPRYRTFYKSGQVVGLLGGLRGAAEYEILLDVEDKVAVKGMSAQSIAHFVIAGFIIFANIVFFAEKFAARKEEE